MEQSDHVCGLQGYDAMRDPPCPGCERLRRDIEAHRLALDAACGEVERLRIEQADDAEAIDTLQHDMKRAIDALEKVLSVSLPPHDVSGTTMHRDAQFIFNALRERYR